MSTNGLQKLAAFTADPEGGNPAGVWIGDDLPDPDTMQRIAAEVGFSETAFVAPATGSDRLVRYYSPEAEVAFCGHATIAAGIVLAEAEGDGVYRMKTRAGEIPVSVATQNGKRRASLTSVAPEYVPPDEHLLAEVLSALGWTLQDLDLTLPPAKAFAGAWHLVLAAEHRDRLGSLEYEFDRLKAIMLRNDLTTLQLVWRENATLFHSRNPFPVGGVIEDPATGAAAAALGGYLRDAKLIRPPAAINIRQGEAMGRPSRISVEIPERGGIIVSGTAVRI